MKLYYPIIVIFSFIIFSCKEKKSQTIITGTILQDIPKEVKYTLPIHGVSYLGFTNSIQFDSLGKFEIRLDIEKPSFVKIFIPKTNISGTLLVEKGKKYSIVFNKKLKNSVTFVSGSKEGQEVINQLPNPISIQTVARKFSNDSVSRIRKILDSLKKTDLTPFQKLKKNRKISHDFYDLIKLDRVCYYATIQGTIALLKKFEDLEKDNGVFTNEFLSLWKDAFETALPNSNDLLRSNWYFDLAENFIQYKEFTNNSFDVEKAKAIYKKGLIHTHNLKQSKKLLSKDMLEYYNARYLLYNAYQKRYEEEFITLFTDFKSQFPDSEYSSFIKPLIAPIVEFHEKKKASKNENIRLLKNYEAKNSLKEVLSSLKGKRLYIDVWATWCGPCKEEFHYNPEFKELLRKNNMEILYISIDRDEKDSQWKDMLQFYNLEGYHIRVNENLKSNLIEIFSKNGAIQIPWYLIIDEHGNILKKYASRPSQVKNLEKEFSILY